MPRRWKLPPEFEVPPTRPRLATRQPRPETDTRDGGENPRRLDFVAPESSRKRLPKAAMVASPDRTTLNAGMTTGTMSLAYPERIPKARLEATLLNRELDDTLFDARTWQTKSTDSWLTAAQDRTVDELLRPEPRPEVSQVPLELPAIDQLPPGGHGACYTITLDTEQKAMDSASVGC